MSGLKNLRFEDQDGDVIEFAFDKKRRVVVETVNGEVVADPLRRIKMRTSDMSVVDAEEEVMIPSKSESFYRAIDWFENVRALTTKCKIEVVGSLKRRHGRRDLGGTSSTSTPRRKRRKKTPPVPAGREIMRSQRRLIESSSTASPLRAAAETISPRVKGTGCRKKMDAVAAAKRAFALAHVPCDQNLPIRGDQVQQVKKFISTHICKHSGGALYVSGSPGTGKTMAVARALQRTSELKKIADVVHVNAMSWHSEKRVGEALCENLGLFRKSWNFCTECRAKGLGGRRAPMERVKCRLFHNRQKSAKMALIVIDEIDAIVHGSTSPTGPLHQLFEWASLPGSRLVLVGIANGVGLVSQYLPRLRALRCEPNMLVFEPYTSEQLLHILRQRLETVGASHLIPDSALEFCAKKVATVSGDARQALDICRLAVDTACRGGASSVGMRDMAKILRVSLGTQSSKRVRETTSRAQLLLCLAVALSKRQEKGGPVSIGVLHRGYAALSRHLRRRPASLDDLQGLLMQLTESGLVSVVQHRHGLALKKRRVCISVPPRDVADAVADDAFMTSLLENPSALV